MSPDLLLTRQRLESKIEDLIELLDLIDGDPDLEPYFAGYERQLSTCDEREDENEHGGDIQDLPHDEIEEGNDEPNLGWSNPRCGEFEVPKGWSFFDAPEDITLDFNGDGHHQARKQLREKVKDQRKLAAALDRTRVSVGYGRSC